MEEGTIFAGYFGNTPAVRILDFLILGKDFDYSMTEIAEGAGVGWTSFTRIWKELEKKKVIVHTREIGRAKLYKLNTRDPTIQQLVRLQWEIVKSETDKLFKEKGWNKLEKPLMVNS